MRRPIRLFKQHINRGQALLSYKILPHLVFPSIFEPNLLALVEFPQKVGPDLVVQKAFDVVASVLDGKSDDDLGTVFWFVDYGGGADGVLGELVAYVLLHAQGGDVGVEFYHCLVRLGG